MRTLRFALARALRSRALLLMLVLTALLPPLAARSARNAAPAPAGYLCLDDGPEADALCEKLEQAGFVPAESEAALRAAVADGDLDCGAVIPARFGARLAEGELDGVIRFVSSPMSRTPALWRSQLSAVLFSLRAPYLTVAALEGTDIPAGEVMARYDELMRAGSRFRFALESVSGQTLKEAPQWLGLFRLVLGITLTAAVFPVVCGECTAHWRGMALRIGARRSAVHLLLPELAVHALLLWLAAAIAAASCGLWQWLLPLAVYIPALMVPAMALQMLVRRGAVVWSAVVLLCLSAVALCPVYQDAALLLPWLQVLRWLHCVWWLWPLTGG